MTDRLDITLNINGQAHSVAVEARRTLADVIRVDCGNTGTHLGCEHGVCGACTVIVDGAPVRSCLMFAVQADGAAIRTVEGLANGETLHPLQRAFITHHALQCGFCTSGMLMTSAELLAAAKPMTRVEIREFLSGNYCRCTGYDKIVGAVKEAARRKNTEC